MNIGALTYPKFERDSWLDESSGGWNDPPFPVTEEPLPDSPEIDSAQMDSIQLDHPLVQVENESELTTPLSLSLTQESHGLPPAVLFSLERIDGGTHEVRLMGRRAVCHLTSKGDRAKYGRSHQRTHKVELAKKGTARHQADKAAVAEYNQTYYEKNREKLLPRARARYQIKKQELLTQALADSLVEKNGNTPSDEKILEKKPEPGQTNKEKKSESNRKHFQAHKKEIITHRKARRHALKEKKAARALALRLARARMRGRTDEAGCISQQEATPPSRKRHRTSK